MKSIGIVRRIDDLGRIVIPAELRRTLGIAEQDPLEIFVDGDTIMLRKYAPGCTFCGNDKEVSSHWNKPLCRRCMNEISRKAQ